MKESSLEHNQQITVRVNDVDFNERIKPGAVMSFFQDIAVEHAEKLGLGFKDMQKKNLLWVMVRMSFKVHKSVKIGEKLNIKTFFDKPRQIDTVRGYYIYNSSGEVVIAGASNWCVLDVNTHRPQRLSQLFDKFSNSDYTPCEPFENVNCKVEALADLDAEIEGPFVFSVNINDLDQNMHMNNSRYGDAAFNVCGMEQLEANAVSRFDINFAAELFNGDRYEVYKVQRENITFIEAKKTETNAVVFRGRIEWNKV